MLPLSAFSPMRICHVDLDQPLSSLAADAEGWPFFCVFWRRGTPLGAEVLAPSQLPMQARRLADVAARAIAPAVGDKLFDVGFEAPLPEPRAWGRPRPPDDLAKLCLLTRPLEALGGRSAPSGGSGVTVSVVVCTRDRPAQLERCLQSLLASSVTAHEVIVVDNAPGSNVTREAVERTPGVTYVAEPRPGLSVARNTGVRHSTGEIVTFTDDDAIVHREWLARLPTGFEDPSVNVVTGLVLPAELETDAQVVFEFGMGGFSQGYRALAYDPAFFARTQRWGAPAWRVGAGANMAVRRQAFEVVGGFDERLGAGAAGCSEDSELWYRLLAAGYVCRYDPTAVVFHYHRRDLDEVRRQAYLYMRGHVAALLVQFARHGHQGNLRRAFVGLPRFFAGRVKRELVFRTWPRQPTLAAEVSGFLAGFRYLTLLASPKSYRRKGPRVA